MCGLRLLALIVLSLSAVVPCQAQSDDDVRDSLRMYQEQVSLLTQQLDSNDVVLATLRRRMRDLIMLKDSLISANDLFQRELKE